MLALFREPCFAHVWRRCGTYSRLPSDEDAEDMDCQGADLLAGTGIDDGQHDGHAFRQPCWARYKRGDFTVLPEGNRYLLAWDFVVTLSLLTTALVLPVEAAFFNETPTWLWQLCAFMDVIFVLDTVLSFNVAFMVPTVQGNDAYERRPAVIARRYMSIPFSDNFTAGWFWPDLLTILPWDMFSRGTETRRFIRSFRLVRMFRLPRLSKLFDRWQKAVGISYATGNVMAVFSGTFLLLHWVSCVWGFTALEYPNAPNWLSAYVEGQKEEIQDELGDDVFLPIGVYNMALYFSSMQLTGVGFGDIYPVGQAEVFLSTVTVLLMGFVWAFVIGMIIKAITSFDTVKSNFQQLNDDMSLLLRKRGLPASLRRRVRGYLQQSFKVHMHHRGQETLAMLSPGLQGEIARQAGMKQICDCVWYLKDLSQIELVEVAALFKAALYTPNETIMRMDAVSVIVRGICSKGGKRILTKHDCIGEDMLLASTYLRDMDHPRTLSFVETMALTRANLAGVCARFPDLSRRMRKCQIRLAMRRAVIHINRNVKGSGAPFALLPSFDELFKQQVDQRFLHSDDLQPLMCSMLRSMHRRLSPEADADGSTATPRSIASNEHSGVSQARNTHRQHVAARDVDLGDLRFQLEALATSQRRIEAQLESLVSTLGTITALPAQQLQQKQQQIEQQQQQHLPQQASLQARQQVRLEVPVLHSSKDDAANETEGHLDVLRTHLEQAFARLKATLTQTRMDLVSASERSWNSHKVDAVSGGVPLIPNIFDMDEVDFGCGRLDAAVLENHRLMDLSNGRPATFVEDQRVSVQPPGATRTQASTKEIIRRMLVEPPGVTTMQASTREIISRQADAFEASMVLQLRRLVHDCMVKAVAAHRA